MKPDVYKELAASGRYLNTGKVLIGLSYIPKQKRMMSRDEERIQAAFLGCKLTNFDYEVTVYILYVLALIMISWAVAKFFV